MFTHSYRLREAAHHIKAGRIVAYPTEAVYGLGCDPCNPASVIKLLALKQRPIKLGLILIASEFNQLLPFIKQPHDDMLKRILPTWPGPVTWLLPAEPATPLWVTGAHDSIAVRVTAHPVAAGLCDALGQPIVSTSANRHGKPSARSALGVQQRFGHQIDYVLGGATLGLDHPSEIRDAASGQIIRAV